MQPVIRLFTEADIPFGMQLVEVAGWNQTPADWRRLRSFCPEGCFIAEVAGRRAGSATTSPYGTCFGWVGMVIVLPEFRRRGIATALLNHAIAFLESRGVSAVRLDATPAGEKVYGGLGFRAEYELLRMEGTALSGQGKPGNPAPADLKPLFAFDAATFGADRSHMLALLYRQAPELTFTATAENGSILAYLMARPGREAFYLGPFAAADPETAERLLRHALTCLQGKRVFLDVPLCNENAALLAQKYRFTPQRPLLRMYRGRLVNPGNPQFLYGISGPETG